MSDEFEKIIQEAIEKAEAVDCPPEAFKDGLQAMAELMQARLEMEGGD